MKGSIIPGPAIVNPVRIQRKLTGPKFLNKYKKSDIIDRMTKLIMGDKYFLTLSADEYQFLNDMNLIGSDDPEFEEFLMQLMKDKIIDFFSGCPDLNAYLEEICQKDEKDKILNMDLDELKDYVDEKINNWEDQKKSLVDNKNQFLTIPGDEQEL